jgi:predicted O-linked N-acetylglucosamine transferase (SPINDLY family)
LEALSFAKPIVTLPGEFMRGRHTSAILRHIGATDTVAASPDEYVNLAVQLARDPAGRNKIEAQIRQNGPRAYHNDQPIRALEKFIRRAVAA